MKLSIIKHKTLQCSYFCSDNHNKLNWCIILPFLNAVFCINFRMFLHFHNDRFHERNSTV